MIKQVAALFPLLISLFASAQPIVIKCTLESEFQRDGVLDELFSGVFCRDCRVAIRVIEGGRVLSLDGFYGRTPRNWEKRDDKLDLNGFGGPSSWRINNEEISARKELFSYGKKTGYAELTISRLTGAFYSIEVDKNPYGSGNINKITKGECQAAKAAF